jgi:flagellar motility protein MotE (MotC chaperone)
MLRQPLQPRTILPLMVFIGVLVVGVRASDVWNSLASGRVFEVVTPSKAAAEKEGPVINPPSLAAASQAADKEGKDGKPATPPGSAASTETVMPNSSTASPSGKTSDEPSGAEMALVRQLTERRDQLEQRSRTLDSREALIKVAEQRVDQKIKEMETLRAQLQTMVSQVSSTQQAQIENLVKIYETMKPKEAARIFETLDLQILLGVVQKMKPQRTSAIMAEMKPEKAKEITVALTKQDQLPQIK